MSTSKDYLDHILEQLSQLDGISHRQMMGEYIICHHGKIAAYLCDDRLLVKPVKSAARLMPDAVYEPPYEGAKDMLLVENVDDREFLKTLFETMYEELPEPKKKRWN
ncbi:MAG: TfoX/Sxy family protein [Oscillospiraceae bacterium]|nr:TfoX/Sxy family protein [Oscillospiraceae bacterium]